MHDFLIAEGEHRAPGTMLWPFSCLSVLSPWSQRGWTSTQLCHLFLFLLLFFTIQLLLLLLLIIMFQPSSCLDPSLLGFPRDGEDSLLVYQQEESSRILDFFEKRFSFLLRGSVSQFSDQRVSISCDDVSSQWDGGAASLILIFLASTLRGIFR